MSWLIFLHVEEGIEESVPVPENISVPELLDLIRSRCETCVLSGIETDGKEVIK